MVVKYQLIMWLPPPIVLVKIVNRVAAAIEGPNGIIWSSLTSLAIKSKMLIIPPKMKLKNKANKESSMPRKDPRIKPSLISPKPRASFLKINVPIAPIITAFLRRLGNRKAPVLL